MEKNITKEILYYTDNRLDPKIDHAVRKQLLAVNIPIVCASLKPMDFGDKRIVIPKERGWGTYFEQITRALEASTADIVFFCEHDVIYPKSHFDFTPPTRNTYYYNNNWWKIRLEDGFAVSWEADQVSGLCCYRELVLPHYQKILATFNRETFNRKFEPGSGEGSESWMSAEPYVDIRQPGVMTKNKWSLADFRDKRTAKNFKTGTCPEWAKDIISGIIK